jgi:hypothetical protein
MGQGSRKQPINCSSRPEAFRFLVARARVLPVRSITLHALGGVTQIEGKAGDAKTELRMAIAGSITSVVIGLICLTLTCALCKPCVGAKSLANVRSCTDAFGYEALSFTIVEHSPFNLRNLPTTGLSAGRLWPNGG